MITQAYHSKCSPWKVSSNTSIASDFSSKVKNENDAILNRISDFDKRRISQPKKTINKLAMNNRILLIAAVNNINCTYGFQQKYSVLPFILFGGVTN